MHRVLRSLGREMTEEFKSDAGGDVTQLLKRWSEGNNESLDPLFNMVYPRLRQIANALFRGESPESMLQPTGLVKRS
jgi:hypothetical protein